MEDDSEQLPTKVRVIQDSGLARFRGSFTSGEQLRIFQRALDGTRYIRERKGRLAPLDKVPAILERLRVAGFDVSMEEELSTALRRMTTQQWLDRVAVRERIEKIDKEIFEITGDRLFPFQKTGAEWLSTRYGGLLADEMGVGKLAACSEPVMTPTGWGKMGELKVGDSVMGSNGFPTEVIGVYPQGLQKQYLVTLTDGASTRCGLEHLWYVETTNSRFRNTKGLVMTTRQIMKLGIRSKPYKNRKRGNSKWFIPIVSPIHFEEKNYSVDPYLIGALIANGALTGRVPTHNGSEDQRDEIRKIIPKDYELHRYNNVTYSICCGGKLIKLLKDLDLLHLSFNKRIPKDYLIGSISQRTSLLQGLLDNDGTTSGMVVEYNTTSLNLAKDVMELVRSLGGSAWLSTRIPKYTYKGEKLEGRVDHRIRMALPSDVNPFRLPRKASTFTKRTKYPPIHAIESIEPCGSEESVCIRVSAKDNLYVTKDYILTHNTRQAIVAIPANAPVLVVCNSAAKGVWAGEVAKCRPHLKARVLQGRDSFRWPREGEMVILNYDILPNVHDSSGKKGSRKCTGELPPEPCKGCKEELIFGSPPKFGSGPQPVRSIETRMGHKPDCNGFKSAERCPGCHPLLDEVLSSTVVVGDEAHFIKNGTAGRTQRFRSIAEAARKKEGRTWLLTGTPLENEPKELWSVFQSAGIAHEAFGDWKTFVKLFKGKASLWGYTWGTPDEEVPEIVDRARRVMLRRLRKDVLPDLPTKMWQEIIVEIDKKALAECDSFLVRSGGLERVVELIEKEKMDFGSMSSVRAALASAKIPAMLDIVRDHEEQGEPLLVFSAHRGPIDLLAKMAGWGVITGDQNDVKKREIAERFQRGELRGLGLTIRAGGTALTLTRAHRELFVDRDWKPTANAQAEDRAVRIGQTRGVVVMILKADHPLDRRVNELLLKKQRLITASVDATSTREDAPEDSGKGFKTQQADKQLLKNLREEISKGEAVQRGISSDEEYSYLENLRNLTFDEQDEIMACELVEEAEMVGLSDAQWEVAARIVGRGKRGAL